MGPAGTATAVVSATATATAETESPTPAVTATGTPPGVVGARDVTFGPDGGLPRGTALLVATAGFDHGGGGFFRVRRVWQLAADDPTGSAEVIPWPGSPDPDSSVLGVAQNEDGTLLWMSRCDGAACYSEGKEGVTTTFLAREMVA